MPEVGGQTLLTTKEPEIEVELDDKVEVEI